MKIHFSNFEWFLIAGRNGTLKLISVNSERDYSIDAFGKGREMIWQPIKWALKTVPLETMERE